LLESEKFKSIKADYQGVNVDDIAFEKGPW
jgi:hypothetical protein